MAHIQKADEMQHEQEGDVLLRVKVIHSKEYKDGAYQRDKCHLGQNQEEMINQRSWSDGVIVGSFI